MAASLIRRTGIPSALEKLKPIQPLPKCFGSLVIRPLRIGTGKPMDTLSNFQPGTVPLNPARNCFGPIRGPEENARSSRSDISSFTYVPPISTTRTFLFIGDRPRMISGVKLPMAPSAQTLKEAPLLWFCRRAGRPAFHNFKGQKTEQQLSGRFQIEPEIFGDLLHRSSAVELGRELGLVRSQFQLLHLLEPLFGVSGNGSRVEVWGLIAVLNQTQSLQRPIRHVWFPLHLREVT